MLTNSLLTVCVPLKKIRSTQERVRSACWKLVSCLGSWCQYQCFIVWCINVVTITTSQPRYLSSQHFPIKLSTLYRGIFYLWRVSPQSAGIWSFNNGIKGVFSVIVNSWRTLTLENTNLSTIHYRHLRIAQNYELAGLARDTYGISRHGDCLACFANKVSLPSKLHQWRFCSKNIFLVQFDNVYFMSALTVCVND